MNWKKTQTITNNKKQSSLVDILHCCATFLLCCYAYDHNICHLSNEIALFKKVCFFQCFK